MKEEQFKMKNICLNRTQIKYLPSDTQTRARLAVIVMVVGIVFSATIAMPKNAFACLLPINLQAIDSRLNKGDLPPDKRVKAHELRQKAAELIESGKANAGRAKYYELMRLLGMPISSGKWRC